MLGAFRVDLKAFTDDFYKKICGARLQPVLDSAALARELGMHVETVTLVIPGLNDSMEEMEKLIRWVIDHLGPATPMHFSAFHPDYKMTDRGATPLATLEKIYTKAKDLGLRFPYLGNVYNHPYENTFCPACGATLIERQGFSSRFWHSTGSSAGTAVKRSRSCAMSPESPAETRFITDRMLGTLTRYSGLWDMIPRVPTGLPKAMQKRIPCSSNLLPGKPNPAHAGRRACTAGKGTGGSGQIRRGDGTGAAADRSRVDRPQVDDDPLFAVQYGTEGSDNQGDNSADYAPQDKTGCIFFWCERCSKLYWNGSHGKHISERIEHDDRIEKRKKGSGETIVR